MKYIMNTQRNRNGQYKPTLFSRFDRSPDTRLRIPISRFLVSLVFNTILLKVRVVEIFFQ